MMLPARAFALTLIYAVLAGPVEAGNWLLGAVLGLALAALTRGTPPAARRSPLRLLTLPWFLLGVAGRIAAGTGQMLVLLLLRRDWSGVGFVTCPTPPGSEAGRDLLALVETASPGSIVSSHDQGQITASVVGAREPEAHCAGLRRWHRRFQMPLLP